MKILQTEIAKKISQLKGIVPRITTVEALHGILYSDGYLTASNLELTVKAKIEAEGGEAFIIPERAFDLINNLPDGEVEITPEPDAITIRIGDISNRFATLKPEMFAYTKDSYENDSCTVPAEKLIGAMRHVAYAQKSTTETRMMNGIYLKCGSGKLELVALDGYRIAYDTISCDGDFQMIVPKAAVDRILGLNLKGDVSIATDKKTAMFKTEDFEIYTRLVEGQYYSYTKMFDMQGPQSVVVNRSDLLEAINRASLCGSVTDREPVILDICGTDINVNYTNSSANYTEKVTAKASNVDPLKIAFNAKMVMDSLRSFADLDKEDLQISFENDKSPAIMEVDGSEMRSLILPCNQKAETT